MRMPRIPMLTAVFCLTAVCCADTLFNDVRHLRHIGPLDDTTITTVLDPDREGVYRTTIAGFDDAETNTVPVKIWTGRGNRTNSDYKIKWMPAGSALRVYTDGMNGSSGDIVMGAGATTNAILFSSATNSNVKITVSKRDDPGNEAIRVTIGVYYR